MTSKIQQKH